MSLGKNVVIRGIQFIRGSFRNVQRPSLSNSSVAGETTQPHLSPRLGNAAAPASRARPVPQRPLCYGLLSVRRAAQPTTGQTPKGRSFPSTTPQPVGLRIGIDRLIRSRRQYTSSTAETSPSPAGSPSNESQRDCWLSPCWSGVFAMGVSSVFDGSLSLDGFNASAKALVDKWREIDVDDDSLPDWAWKPCCKMGVPSEIEGFLALEGVYHIGAGSQIEESNSLDEGTVEHDTWVQSSTDNIHVYDFHIVYSFSYKVPVLYFQGHQAGGQLLTLDEIKEDLPSNSFKVLSESKWTFITREEHPHLSRPWFTLHPCGTSDWMKLLLDKLGDKDQSLQYLSAWLSVVGQAVGLKIPLKLYCNS